MQKTILILITLILSIFSPIILFSSVETEDQNPTVIDISISLYSRYNPRNITVQTNEFIVLNVLNFDRHVETVAIRNFFVVHSLVIVNSSIKASTGPINEGEQVSVNFTAPSTPQVLLFICVYHPKTMNGTINVVENSNNGGGFSSLDHLVVVISLSLIGISVVVRRRKQQI